MSERASIVTAVQTDQWTELVRALTTVKEEGLWSRIGPYNRKNFHALVLDSVAETSDLPDVLRQFYRLFTSEAILVILSDLTGIRLHPNSVIPDANISITTEGTVSEAKRARTVDETANSADVTSSAMDSEWASLTDPQLRRWRSGCYTLLADTDLIGGSWRLESVFHVAGFGKPVRKHAKYLNESGPEKPSPCWDPAWGGQIVYVAKDEPDDLLTVRPVDNALTLVYIGPDTASFVQYINHTAKSIPTEGKQTSHTISADSAACAYDLALTYYEPMSDVQSEIAGSSIVGSDDFSMSSEDFVEDGDEITAASEESDEKVANSIAAESGDVVGANGPDAVPSPSSNE
ncbi:unnamed protein product [Echinostoma caproni]|uniref:Ofd1_CTDD domain-containing protein n=1 Tax=Echinostoma caproni TaxID=27848 RepID=A0A183APU5_9TREM|nr:unnamed protein product [Echinostoma caproni]